MEKYIDKETSKKVDAITNNAYTDELLDKIKDFNSKFDNSTSDLPSNDLDLKKLEDIVIDDNAIEKQANDELADYKKTNVDKIYNQTKAKEEELNLNKESLKENYSSSKARIEKNYDNARQKASDDALRRGLSRSSIVINQLDAFNKEELDLYNQLDKDLTAKINQVDFELNALQTQQDLALSEFDIAYAVKLNSKINSLKQELLEKQNEVVKYNNQIAEKEAQYKLKYEQLEQDLKNDAWDKEKDLMNITIKYGSNAVQKYKQNQIYNMVDEYLASLSKEEAIKILENNNEIRNYLTSTNLNTLLKKYK